MQDIFLLGLDPGKNLGWCTWLDQYLDAHPEVHCQVYIRSMQIWPDQDTSAESPEAPMHCSRCNLGRGNA